MYGGRVTDDMDRRTLVCYLNEYLGDFVFDEREPFFLYQNIKTKTAYNIPVINTIPEFQEYIYNNIPTKNFPTVFGLNINAEIIYSTNASNLILISMLDMQTGVDTGGADINIDQIVTNAVVDIQNKLIPPYELDKVKDQIDNSVDDPKDPKY